MPSAFDDLFAAIATPTLFATFAVPIDFEIRDAGGLRNRIEGVDTGGETRLGQIYAHVGRETVRSVRDGNGRKVIRTREALVSTNVDDHPSNPDLLTEEVQKVIKLKNALYLLNFNRSTIIAWVEGIQYVVTGYDRAPGHMARLNLERSDPSKVRRPNMEGRR